MQWPRHPWESIPTVRRDRARAVEAPSGLAGDTLWAGGAFLNAGNKISTGIGAWDFGQ